MDIKVKRPFAAGAWEIACVSKAVKSLAPTISRRQLQVRCSTGVEYPETVWDVIGNYA